MKKNKDIVSDKRDLAFQSVVSMRDAISLATKKIQPPTYEQSLRIFYDLDPEVYEEFSQLLAEKNENDIVKLYKEEAKLQSKVSGVNITPSDLIKIEISRLTELKSEAGGKSDVKFIERKIAQLYSGLENIEPRRLSENAILTRDFAQVDRTKIFGEVEYSGFKHVDYILSKERRLRIRLLHPDIEEHKTGADLIYEQYDTQLDRVRFVFLQYKTWDDGSIYFSQSGNLLKQMKKLKHCLCDKKYCTGDSASSGVRFRFPYCSSFLRPTDRLQHRRSKMVSSGLHIPICDVVSISKVSNQIRKQDMKENSLTHHLFESLFALELIGSRWINAEDVEKFYKEYNILDKDECIKIYVREFQDKATENEFYDDDDDDDFWN